MCFNLSKYQGTRKQLKKLVIYIMCFRILGSMGYCFTTPFSWSYQWLCLLGIVEKLKRSVLLSLYSQCADNKLIQNGIKILPFLISMKSKTVNGIMYYDYYEYCFLLLVFIWFAYVLYILIFGNFERRLNCDMNL